MPKNIWGNVVEEQEHECFDEFPFLARGIEVERAMGRFFALIRYRYPDGSDVIALATEDDGMLHVHCVFSSEWIGDLSCVVSELDTRGLALR